MQARADIIIVRHKGQVKVSSCLVCSVALRCSCPGLVHRDAGRRQGQPSKPGDLHLVREPRAVGNGRPQGCERNGCATLIAKCWEMCSPGDLSPTYLTY